jgi:LytS/YehU family sensor histidine kinase
MKSEYKALNALMNPHFIFNTLNNVQGLVNKDEKLAANQYLRIFANLIRQNMYNISRDLIPLQNEIDLVENYLKLEKLRFKDRLNYAINITDDGELMDIMIPPLLVQPLVENSIKHGILPLKSTESFININVFEKDNSLVIEIKDNGVGMNKTPKPTNPLHGSFGIENIRKRIEQLRIIQNKKISLDFSELTDEEGNLLWTVATITISVN